MKALMSVKTVQLGKIYRLENRLVVPFAIQERKLLGNMIPSYLCVDVSSGKEAWCSVFLFESIALDHNL